MWALGCWVWALLFSWCHIVRNSGCELGCWGGSCSMLYSLIASGNILGELKTLFFAAINVFIVGNLLDPLHISPVQLRNLYLRHVFQGNSLPNFLYKSSTNNCLTLARIKNFLNFIFHFLMIVFLLCFDLVEMMGPISNKSKHPFLNLFTFIICKVLFESL